MAQQTLHGRWRWVVLLVVLVAASSLLLQFDTVLVPRQLRADGPTDTPTYMPTSTPNDTPVTPYPTTASTLGVPTVGAIVTSSTPIFTPWPSMTPP